MFSEFLKLTWDEILDSNYQIKSNSFRHVIEISGSEFLKKDSDCLILVYYNVYTGKPMIALMHYGRTGIEPEQVDGYFIRKDEGVDEGEGTPITEFMYLSQDIKDALEEG